MYKKIPSPLTQKTINDGLSEKILNACYHDFRVYQQLFKNKSLSQKLTLSSGKKTFITMFTTCLDPVARTLVKFN